MYPTSLSAINTSPIIIIVQPVRPMTIIIVLFIFQSPVSPCSDSAPQEPGEGYEYDHHVI